MKTFTVGQKVKIKDMGGLVVKGEVVDVTENSVFIQWEDMIDPIEYFPKDYNQIKPL